MIRFETVVKVLVFTFGVVNVAAHAQTLQIAGGNQNVNWEIYKELCKTPEQRATDDCKKYLADSRAGSSTETCETLEREYKKAKGDFTASCGNVPSSPGARTSDIGCSWTFVRCNACVGNPDETTRANFSCESTSLGGATALLSNPAVSQILQQQGMPAVDTQTVAARGKLSNCPELAATDLDKLKKEIEDFRKEAKKAAKEIPEMKEKQNKAVANTNKDIDSLRKKMADDTKAHRKELRDSAKAKDSANKGITDQVFQIEDKITMMIDEKAKNDLAAVDAAIKLKQTKVAIELNCHQSASAQVGKMQADILAGSKGNLSKSWVRGGMSSMMKLVGMSDRKYWKKNAEILYQECLASKPTIDAKASANDAYQFALQQSGAQERSLESKIAKAREQQKTMNGACVDEMTGGPAAVESEACKVARNASQDAQAMAADFEATQNANNVSYQMLQKQGYDEWESAENSIAERQAEIDDEKLRLFNMESMYTMKNQIAGGVSSDKKDLAEARAKFGQFVTAANAFVSKPGCQGELRKEADNFLISALPGRERRVSSDRLPAADTTSTTPPTTPAAAPGGAGGTGR